MMLVRHRETYRAVDPRCADIKETFARVRGSTTSRYAEISELVVKSPTTDAEKSRGLRSISG
jgi:hypothetical protein